ncbi:MAG: hypothetical protein FJW94_06980 [Actinobacteria bacterium]|nr:hypothetical protein [Actinomycetota bacterium]
MTSLVIAATAGFGVWMLAVPAAAAGPGRTVADRWSHALRVRLDRAGLAEVSTARYIIVSLSAALLGGLLATLATGWSPVAAVVGLAVGAAPSLFWHRRHRVAVRAAQDHWPRLLEELRIQVGPIGRSIPQALIEVGTRAPAPLRPAFDAAAREWSLRTDLEGMLRVLADHLGDASADATCETLLVIHQVGGDLDTRLADLAEARRRDLEDRRESDARQSGARLARWFVVIVPLGMGFAGMNVGDGAAAYRGSGAVLLMVAAGALVAVCWWWAGRLMRLPEERRVFAP